MKRTDERGRIEGDGPIGRKSSLLSRQTGQGIVEFAVVLPLILLLMLATVDLGRLFYAYITLAGAAHTGAMYGSSSAGAATDAASIRNAVLADTATLFDSSSGNLTVSSSSGSDPFGYQSVVITVTYTFHPLFPYPGLPHSIGMSRSATMRVKP